MAVEVSFKHAEQAVNIFKSGNLVQLGDKSKIVYVTGPGNTPDHFAGFCIAGYGQGQMESDGWVRRLFKQFVGTVTLEGKL